MLKNLELENEFKFFGVKKFEKFCEENKIFFIEKNFVDLKEVVLYCKKNEKIFGEKIILETGVNAMKNFFVRNLSNNNNNNDCCDCFSPIDFLLISVYYGEINEKNLGGNFTSFSDIENSGLILTNISKEIKSEKGYLKFYTFVNKRIIEI